MYTRVTSFLDSQNLIYSRQFGFRKSHSTLHTLTVIVERIRKSLDIGELACGVLVDLQKVFDTVLIIKFWYPNLIIMVLEAPAKTGSSRTYLTDINLWQSKIRSLVLSLTDMVFPKALCWVPCCSCIIPSMICTWQLNFLKHSILQTIAISCILQKPLDLSVQKLMLISGVLLLG